MMLGTVGLNALPTQKASAGWTETMPVPSTALSNGSLDVDWRDSGTGISLESGKIRFCNASKDARVFYKQELITRTVKSNYVIKATIEVDGLTGNKCFGIGFGFERTSYTVGKKNTNYFFVQQSDSGYTAGLWSYNADSEKTEHTLTSPSLSGTKWDVVLTATYPNKLKAEIGGKTVFEGALTSNTIEGYFGFLETGTKSNSTQYVSNLTVSNGYYLTPQNMNVNDDFNDNCVDASAWHIYEFDAENTKLPIGEQGQKNHLAGIAETNGQLQFIDAFEDTFSTRYKYSNFEMRLDIPYVRKQAEYNSDGTIRRGVSSAFGIFCGIDVAQCTDIQKATVVQEKFPSYCLTFQSEDFDKNKSMETTVRFGNSKDEERQDYMLPKKYDLWDEKNEDKVLNVVFTCIDGNYSLDVKWAEETQYHSVFSVKLPDKEGFISLFGLGGPQQKTNVAFDNIKITNRDYNGDIISGLFPESNETIKENEDYGYADTKSPSQLVPDGTDFDGVQAIGDEGGCSSVVDIGGISIATLAMGTAVITRRRKRK